MNIGDRVTVSLVMEVEGIVRDAFSTEIMIQGKINSGEKGHFFISVPESMCHKIEGASVVA